MSTTLSAAMAELSKQLGDYWSSASTSAGASGGTTIVDTALKAKSDDWITDESYTRITESADSSENDERKILSLDNDSGTLTTFAHTAQIPTTCDYEIHRLFTASEKRRALVHAAKAGFSSIFTEVRDESKTVGNWLRNGDVEQWASTSYPDYWRVSNITATEETTILTRGSSSCKLATSVGGAGYLYTSDTLVPEFRALAGKTVKFKAKVHCDTASCCRLAILYDGTNLTYGEYHPGTSNWADKDGYNYLDSFLYVEKQIDYDPTSIEFRVYVEDASATVYVNDLRVIGSTRDKVYIGDLNIAQEQPHQVLQQHDRDIYKEPWILLHGCKVGSDDYLYLPPSAIKDYRLRIIGTNYLDFYDSSDDVGTDWDDTIAIDSPQTEILVAEAAIYLCNQKIVPNDTSGVSTNWERARAYWQRELRDRQARFGMVTPSATVNWGV